MFLFKIHNAIKLGITNFAYPNKQNKHTTFNH